MRVWSVAAMMAMCLLLGVASAQSYTIRVTRNTNLRASYSLESAIVGSAPAGTTLKVVGRHNRWLRVNRNGNDAWMADWVAYTRVEGSEPTPGEGAGDIDNCCFVDRQCHSDQDWTDGYWAFQNDQCQAPAQSQSQTSSQPVSGASAQVDNCCFVDRQCRTDQEWSNGYHAYQLNQCGAAGQSVGSVDLADDKRQAIRIEGSARFIAAVNASLDMLKARAPRWYVYTVFGHDWILELPEGTVVSAPQDVMVRPVAPDDGYLQAGTCEFVGYLVHYAAHNYQTQRDLALGPEILPASLPDEREALTLQIEAMEACCPGHPWLPGFRHALANIDKLEYQWWH